MHSRWMARIRLATISLAAVALCAAAVRLRRSPPEPLQRHRS